MWVTLHFFYGDMVRWLFMHVCCVNVCALKQAKHNYIMLQYSSIGFVVASLPGWVLLVCEHKTQGLRSYPRCSPIWNDLPWAQGCTELLCHS